MKHKKTDRLSRRTKKNNWPITYRWAAMGTLVAYSAFGASKMTLAYPFPVSGTGENASDQHALLVRKFDIAPGTLQETIAAFEKITDILVTFSEEGLKTLRSPGVTGLYSGEQALRILLGDNGASYFFTSPDAITIRVSSLAQSVEVSAQMLDMLPSPKYTGLLQDTPQTITVVSQQILQEQSANTLRDALRNVAGISLAAGEGGAQGDNLTIRGFSARSDIFLDGMRDFGSYFRDTFNFESIDVVQGPTSVTFGRGSTGGIVNQESKSAAAGKFLAGNVEFGSDMTKRITADINEPLGNSAAFRLNIMGNDANVAERDITQNRRIGVAPSLAFGLGTPTRVVLNYLHPSEFNIPDYGIPWLYNGPAPVDRNNYYGFEHGDHINTSVDVGTIRLEHDFNDSVSLRSQTRYGHYIRDVQVTEARIVSTPSVGTPLEDIDVTRNQIAVNSLETFLDSQLDLTMRFNTGFAKHALVAGIELGRETSSPDRYSWSDVPGTSLLDPDENQPFSGTRAITSHVNTLARSFGAYFVDTIALGHSWDLIGGIRYDRFDTDYSALNYTYNPNTVTPAQFSRLDQKPSYRAAIVRWQVLSSYAYLDRKLASSAFYPQYVGFQLANVPKNTFNMWTTYALPWKFLVGAGTQFVDSRTASTTAPLDPTTGLVKTIPSYWVFNAMGSHPLSEHINLQLNLYNLANRYYFDQPHPAHIIPGAGFTALGGINFKF